MTEVSCKINKLNRRRTAIDLRDGRTRQEQRPGFVTERILDIANTRPPHQQLHSQDLQAYGVAPERGADPGAEGLVPAGNLRG